MVRKPDATMQPAPQDNQLMSKHRVLGFKSHLRLEWRGQDGQNETKQPDHSASLGDSITSSTGIRFSVHTLSNRLRHVRSDVRWRRPVVRLRGGDRPLINRRHDCLLLLQVDSSSYDLLIVRGQAAAMRIKKIRAHQ